MGRGRKGPRQTGRSRARAGQRRVSTTKSDKTACAGRARPLNCAIGEMRAAGLEERGKICCWRLFWPAAGVVVRCIEEVRFGQGLLADERGYGRVCSIALEAFQRSVALVAVWSSAATG